MGPVLTELVIGDDATAWAGAGFEVEGGLCAVGGVGLSFAGDAGERGVIGWTLGGLLGQPADIEGIATALAPSEVDGESPSHGGAMPSAHPNGVLRLDHVVVASPDLGRTTRALEDLGFEARREREAGSAQRPSRQVFFWIGEPILELVGPPEPRGTGPARIFGLAFAVADLDATAAWLGERAGRVKDAVQPGRRITTLRHEPLGVSVPVAFMSPHPKQDR